MKLISQCIQMLRWMAGPPVGSRAALFVPSPGQRTAKMPVDKQLASQIQQLDLLTQPDQGVFSGSPLYHSPLSQSASSSISRAVSVSFTPNVGIRSFRLP